MWTTLYQFTFFPNPDWSRFVAPAQEIKKYLETFAGKYDLYPHIQFGTKLMSATWRQDEGMWKVSTLSKLLMPIFLDPLGAQGVTTCYQGH